MAGKLERTFIVELSEQSDPQAGQCSGRVEHLLSGMAVRFASVEEMLAFLGICLATPGAPERG